MASAFHTPPRPHPSIQPSRRLGDLMNEAIERAKEHFGRLLEAQLARVERMKRDEGWLDYASLQSIVIGVCGGDGIGPYISREAQRVLEHLLRPEVEGG